MFVISFSHNVLADLPDLTVCLGAGLLHPITKEKLPFQCVMQGSRAKLFP